METYMQLINFLLKQLAKKSNTQDTKYCKGYASCINDLKFAKEQFEIQKKIK